MLSCSLEIQKKNSSELTMAWRALHAQGRRKTFSIYRHGDSPVFRISICAIVRICILTPHDREPRIKLSKRRGLQCFVIAGLLSSHKRGQAGIHGLAVGRISERRRSWSCGSSKFHDVPGMFSCCVEYHPFETAKHCRVDQMCRVGGEKFRERKMAGLACPVPGFDPREMIRISNPVSAQTPPDEHFSSS